MLTAAQKRQVGIRVHRGAKLLDENVPNWHKKVNKESLLLESPEQCLLGQQFGDFSHGLVELAGLAIERAIRQSGLVLSDNGSGAHSYELEAEHYGFEASSMVNSDQEYSLLGENWKAAIDARYDRDKRSRAAKKGAARRRLRAGRAVRPVGRSTR